MSSNLDNRIDSSRMKIKNLEDKLNLAEFYRNSLLGSDIMTDKLSNILDDIFGDITVKTTLKLEDEKTHFRDMEIQEKIDVKKDIRNDKLLANYEDNKIKARKAFSDFIGICQRLKKLETDRITNGSEIKKLEEQIHDELLELFNKDMKVAELRNRFVYERIAYDLGDADDLRKINTLRKLIFEKRYTRTNLETKIKSLKELIRVMKVKITIRNKISYIWPT